MSSTSSIAKGIGFLLIGVGIVPLMDGIAKHLSQTLPVEQITWARYALGTIIILPILVRAHGIRSLWVDRFHLQLLRGACLLAATYSFFSVLKYLPIADTLALAFVYPLIVTVLSPWLLGENVGWRRYLAVAIGFVGAIVIIQPGATLFRPIAIVGLLPGCFFAAYVVLTRKLAGTAPALVTLGYGAVLGGIATSILVPAFWVPPQPSDWLWFMALGVIASFSHLLMIKAYEAAPASILAPFGYAEMPMAVLVGWLWFDEWPTRMVWLGIAIIVGAGLFISWRETRRGMADN